MKKILFISALFISSILNAQLKRVLEPSGKIDTFHSVVAFAPAIISIGATTDTIKVVGIDSLKSRFVDTTNNNNNNILTWDSANHKFKLAPPSGSLALDSIIVTANSLGSTLSRRIVGQNNTAATNVLGQNSPTIELDGNYWTGSVSSNAKFSIYANGQASPPYLDFKGASGSTIMKLQNDGTVVAAGVSLFSNGNINGGAINASSLFTSANGTLIVQNAGYSSTGTNRGLSLTTGTVTMTGGEYVGTHVSPIYNETGSTTNNTAFRIQPFYQSSSSGSQWLFEAGTRATSSITSTFTPKLQIDTSGNVTQKGNLTLGTAGNALNITEGTNGRVGQTTLVSGTKAITINGLTTSSRAFITLVTPSGVNLTTSYQAVCTSNTLTIQANVSAGTINTADGSTLNYFVIN